MARTYLTDGEKGGQATKNLKAARVPAGKVCGRMPSKAKLSGILKEEKYNWELFQGETVKQAFPHAPVPRGKHRKSNILSKSQALLGKTKC